MSIVKNERVVDMERRLEREKAAAQKEMPTQTVNLSKEERQRLASLLAELKSRGLSVSDELKAKKVKWPEDSSGYTVKSDGIFFLPYDQMEKFVHSPARFNLFRGSRGSGKTASGAQKALSKIKLGLPGAVVNPDFENFKISTWPEFREWIPWNLVIASQRYRRQLSWSPHQPFQLNFITGSVVICKGLKDIESARGPNINWLWYDEGQRDKTGEAWRIAEASVRIKKYGISPQSWVTATPKGKYHWLYDFFVSKNISPEALDLFTETMGEGIPLIDHFYGTIFDNKNNLDPGFFASMLAAYPAGFLRDQEIYGLFVEEGGVLGDSSWFKGKVLTTRPETVFKRVRFWDLAATEKKMMGGKKNDPDETVGTLMSLLENRRDTCIEDQVSGFWVWDDIKENIKQTAIFDGKAVKIVVEEEPGSGGKNQVAEINSYLKKELPGHPGAVGYRPEGDRVMLANIWFAEASVGYVYVLEGKWNKDFFMQLDGFPEAAHDDKITSVSGARINLAPINKWKNIPFLSL